MIIDNAEADSPHLHKSKHAYTLAMRNELKREETILRADHNHLTIREFDACLKNVEDKFKQNNTYNKIATECYFTLNELVILTKSTLTIAKTKNELDKNLLTETISLNGSPFDKERYEKALELSTSYNLLFQAISINKELKKLLSVDKQKTLFILFKKSILSEKTLKTREFLSRLRKYDKILNQLEENEQLKQSIQELKEKSILLAPPKPNELSYRCTCWQRFAIELHHTELKDREILEILKQEGLTAAGGKPISSANLRKVLSNSRKKV